MNRDFWNLKDSDSHEIDKIWGPNEMHKILKNHVVAPDQKIRWNIMMKSRNHCFYYMNLNDFGISSWYFIGFFGPRPQHDFFISYAFRLDLRFYLIHMIQNPLDFKHLYLLKFIIRYHIHNDEIGGKFPEENVGNCKKNMKI